jgi:hypothetical protein
METDKQTIEGCVKKHELGRGKKKNKSARELTSRPHNP